MRIREWQVIRLLFLMLFLLLSGCDDQESTESGVPPSSSEPESSDLAQASRIAGAAQAGAIGAIGPDSRDAIRAFQKSNNLPVTGLIDPSLLKALKLPAVPRVTASY